MAIQPPTPLRNAHNEDLRVFFHNLGILAFSGLKDDALAECQRCKVLLPRPDANAGLLWFSTLQHKTQAFHAYVETMLRLLGPCGLQVPKGSMDLAEQLAYASGVELAFRLKDCGTCKARVCPACYTAADKCLACEPAGTVTASVMPKPLLQQASKVAPTPPAAPAAPRPTGPIGLSDRVKELAKKGDKIGACKACMSETGAGLAEAKQAIEAWLKIPTEQPTPVAPRPTGSIALSDRVKELAKKGDKIGACKACMSETGAGLADVKQAIEAWLKIPTAQPTPAAAARPAPVQEKVQQTTPVAAAKPAPVQEKVEHPCPWCDAPSTRSITYARYNLTFPFCGSAACKAALDNFMSTSAVLLTADVAGATKDPALARRINSLKKYAAMQR